MEEELSSCAGGHVLPHSDLTETVRGAFVISCDVLFEHFDRNYPMMASSETNAFQLHGLGPVYGSDRGRIVFYLYTTTGKGPHGRGTGQCRSRQKLQPNTWHHVQVTKTARTLTVQVDGESNSVQLPDEMDNGDFVMRETGSIVLMDGAKPDHFLHGKMKNFKISAPSRPKSAYSVR